MNIAYIGQNSGTSLHRAYALKRLGHRVSIIDPLGGVWNSKWVSRWLYYLGGLGIGLFIDRGLYTDVKETAPDLVWVDQGSFLSPGCLRKLGTVGVPIVNYVVDDPFSGRDGMRFYYYRQSVPFYDLIVVVRKENIVEVERAGARNVMLVWRSADEIAHRPRMLSSAEQCGYASEVAFVGTWMPERGPFLAELIRQGLPLSIWGDKWQKSPEWPVIKPFWRGPGLLGDEDYSAAILAAKICLGLLSKGNRDLHTQRSLEIPSLGGLFCAERTPEHLELYQDGVEAFFWDNATECAAICKYLLANDDLRKKVAQNGHERAMHNNLFNEPILASILEKAVMQNS